MLVFEFIENGPEETEGCDLRLPWENMTLSTFPKAERATKTDNTRSAWIPNMLRKNMAATIRPELMISSLGTAAKYAI